MTQRYPLGMSFMHHVSFSYDLLSCLEAWSWFDVVKVRKPILNIKDIQSIFIILSYCHLLLLNSLADRVDSSLPSPFHSIGYHLRPLFARCHGPLLFLFLPRKTTLPPPAPFMSAPRIKLMMAIHLTPLECFSGPPLARVNVCEIFREAPRVIK